MAGHSKFANIKHRKAAQDAKRDTVEKAIKRGAVMTSCNSLVNLLSTRAKSGVLTALFLCPRTLYPSRL